MSVFKMFATLGLDKSSYDAGLSEGERQASTFGEKLKSGIGGAAQAVGAAIGAAATGVAALTKSAVENYANYEQLVGGVETLFGAGGKSLEEYAADVGKSVDEVRDEYDYLIASQETVMQNAESAYKNAGLSANEYMETVTSFSASLLQSLGGDTEKAAKYADTAIRDMSDKQKSVRLKRIELCQRCAA